MLDDPQKDTKIRAHTKSSVCVMKYFFWLVALQIMSSLICVKNGELYEIICVDDF